MKLLYPLRLAEPGLEALPALLRMTDRLQQRVREGPPLRIEMESLYAERADECNPAVIVCVVHPFARVEHVFSETLQASVRDLCNVPFLHAEGHMGLQCPLVRERKMHTEEPVSPRAFDLGPEIYALEGMVQRHVLDRAMIADTPDGPNGREDRPVRDQLHVVRDHPHDIGDRAVVVRSRVLDRVISQRVRVAFLPSDVFDLRLLVEDGHESPVHERQAQLVVLHPRGIPVA